MSAVSTAATPTSASPVVSAFRAAYAAGKEMPRSGIVLPTSWTDEAREYFEERAAMLEYTAGVTREEAEQLAMTQTCLALGVEGIQAPKPPRAPASADDGLADLFGELAPAPAKNAVTEGH